MTYINIILLHPGSERMESLHNAGKRWVTLLIVGMLFNGSITLLFDNAEGDGIGTYPPPTDGDWIITEETEVSDEIIILTGNLIIESDASLLLMNTTILFNCSYDGEFGVTVKSGGELQVQGRKEFTEGARLSGDYDLFSGSDGGTIRFYQNTGTMSAPDWQDPVNLKDVNGDDVNPGSRSAPFLADLDNDGDLDLIIGERRDNGQVNYYENSGTATEPAWTRDDAMFSGVSSGGHSKPALADLDNDGDLDLVVGEEDGEVFLFRNIGTPEAAQWDSRENMKDDGGDNIDVDSRCWPILSDLDNDGDFDLTVGRSGQGEIRFFRNTGTASNHEFTSENSMFSGVSAGQWNPSPAFADLDNDGDFDLTLGSYQSGFFYYENTGTREVPEWTEDDTMYAGVDNQNRMQPAFADIDGDGPGFIPGAAIWHTEFNTTGQYTFDFLVEDDAHFEMEETRIINCGNGDPGHLGLTISADDVTIVDNLFDWNHRAIVLDDVSNVVIRENTFDNNTFGVYVQGGSDVELINNTFTYNQQGIHLEASEDDTLRNNTFVMCSVLIQGTQASHFASHTFFNNSVNGGYLYYYANENGVTVPGNASSVILASCTNMVLEGLHLYGGDVGVELAFSDNTIITDSVIDGCDRGLYLYGSQDNRIMYTTISNGIEGLRFEGASAGNILHFNSIFGNDNAGADASDNGGSVVDAVKNYWGAPSGPHHPTANPSGKGNAISDDILFEPWLRSPHGENVWYVDASSPDGGIGTQEDPYNRIQDALDNASKSEDVFVLSGTYTENLEFSRTQNLFGNGGGANVVLNAGGGAGITVRPTAEGTTVANLSIINGATDLRIEADTFLWNTSFSGAKVNFAGESLMSVGYYLDITTLNIDGKPVVGTVLEMTDTLFQTTLYYTDDQGMLEDQTVLEYRRNATDTVQFSPYSLDVFDFATGYADTILDMESDTNIVFTLTRHGLFGTSIATGDLNNDGIEDIAVGSPTDSQNGENTGAVFIFFGPRESSKTLRPIDADMIIHGDVNGSRIGETIVIGDIDDDTTPDLIVGSPDFKRTLTGITGNYYNGADYTDLEFTRIDSTIDFPWGNSDPGGLGDAFSVIWTGSLKVDEEEDYTFFAEIDDTMYVYIDGDPVIERGSYDAAEAASDPIHLEPGYHDIVIYFSDGGSGARAILKWESAGIGKSVIPQENFHATFDIGAPDGGVFFFDGALFNQEAAIIEMNDGFLLPGTGEGSGSSLAIGDIDDNRYPDLLVGNSLGVEVYYGQSTIDETIEHATLYGIEQPVLVENDNVETLAAVASGDVRLFSVAQNAYSLESYTEEEDFKGSFNQTRFNDGLTLHAYRMVEILPNRDFDNGWDNWTRTESYRSRNDGFWDITEIERGDWKVYDGPTAGLGPHGNNINDGSDNDGKLVSEPFTVPDGLEFIDFWHHAKWDSFEEAGPSQWQDEYADLIIIRVVNDSNGIVIAEQKYGADYGGGQGEEEGRLSFDVSDHQGELLRFEMELSNNRPANDDGIVQIDNITGLQTVSDAKGTFTSNMEDLGFTVSSLVPHWVEELNEGTLTVHFRTNSSDDWTLLENDGLTELPEGTDTTFQYKVTFEATPGKSYPVLTELNFNLFSYLPESLGDGVPFNAGKVFGNDTLGVIDDTTVVLYNGTDIAFTITADQKIDKVTAIGDTDANGISDLSISSDGTVYIVFLDPDSGEGDMELKDALYSFSGEEGADFGTVLQGNLVGSPLEHLGDGRVYLLPTSPTDSAIGGVDIMNNSMIYPDTELSMNLTIFNRGLLDDDSLRVTMTITGDDAYFYEESTVISIASWEGALVNFLWDVPDVEGANYKITFSVPSDDLNTNNELSLDLRAHYHALDLHTGKDFDVVRPAGVLRYLLVVDNFGTFGPDNITFQADVPVNWEWWVRKGGDTDDDPDDPDLDYLIVEDNATIQLFVVANTSILGDYPIQFRTISENGVTTAAVDLTGYVVEMDIIPVDVGLFRADGKAAKLVAGENTTLVLEVQNIGSQDTGIFDVRMDVENGPSEILSGGWVEGFGSVNINFTRAFTEGLHNLTFVVDIDDNVKEYNESNNVFMLQIRVWPGTASTPFMFNVKVVDQFGANITEAYVCASSGDSKVENTTDDHGNITLTLSPPYSEGSIYRVEAQLVGLYAREEIMVYSEDVHVDILLVVGIYSIDLICDQREKDMMPDGQGSFTFNFTNTGDFNDNYTISLAGVPQDWTFDLTGGGILDDLLALEVGITTTLMLDLNSWKYAPAHERYEIILTASSETSPYSIEQILLMVTILPVENLTVYTEDPDEHGLPKDPISHRIYITNSGNSDRTINLMLSGDIDYASLNKEEFVLEPGDVEEVLLVIIIPNLRDGTLLHHQLSGVVAGIGPTTTINFTTLIDMTSGQYFQAEVQQDRLIITNTGNHLEQITVTAVSDLATILLSPESFEIDLEKSESLVMTIEMTDLSIPYGSLIPVFVSIWNGERYFVNNTRLVPIPAVENLSLSVDNPILKAIPGTIAEFSIHVQNTGNVEEMIFFEGTNSGSESLILPSPITLLRNKEEVIPLRVQVPEANSGIRMITFTGVAGETVVSIDLQLDPSVYRESVLDEISAMTDESGTRYIINIYNNGEVEERLDLDVACGELNLLIAKIQSGEHIQFHLTVPHGQFCTELIRINATSDLGEGLEAIIEVNAPPFVTIEIKSTIPASVSDPVILEASGDYASYLWAIDGRNVLGQEIYYNFTSSGLHQIELTVRDDRDISSRFIIDILVENQPPVIEVEPTLFGNAGEYFNLNARESYDPDGTIVEFRWIIENESYFGPNIQHVFQTGGTYSVTLQVTDNDGMRSTKEILVRALETEKKDPGTGEKEELDMQLVGISSALLLALVGIIAFLFFQMNREESTVLQKLNSLESVRIRGTPEVVAQVVPQPEERTCPSCGHQVPENFKFCNKCGTYFDELKGDQTVPPKKVFCIECGHQVPENFKFCNKCGSTIDHEEVGS